MMSSSDAFRKCNIRLVNATSNGADNLGQFNTQLGWAQRTCSVVLYNPPNVRWTDYIGLLSTLQTRAKSVYLTEWAVCTADKFFAGPEIFYPART